MKKITQPFIIALYISLGIFSIVTISTLSFMIYILFNNDLESLGWLFMYSFSITFIPVVLILLITLLIDFVKLKIFNKLTKIIGWFAFYFSLLFWIFIRFPIIKTITIGMNPVWIYIGINLIFIGFIIVAISNIMKNKKLKS